MLQAQPVECPDCWWQGASGGPQAASAVLSVADPAAAGGDQSDPLAVPGEHGPQGAEGPHHAEPARPAGPLPQDWRRPGRSGRCSAPRGGDLQVQVQVDAQHRLQERGDHVSPGEEECHGTSSAFRKASIRGLNCSNCCLFRTAMCTARSSAATSCARPSSSPTSPR